jgi:multiple sugar transport system substrate-binding protein
MDDPTKSAVVGKINVAVLPHGPGGKPSPTLGHFIGAIPKNIPRDRQVAALTFLKWFQTTQAQQIVASAGAPPIRKDVLESEMSNKPENRWMKAMVDSAPYARSMYTVPEGPQIVSVLELRLNEALTGDKGTAEALNTMATEIQEIMRKGGYKTGRLPDLK